MESLLLILIAIIYFRGYLKLKKNDETGTAFIFVAGIMGLVLAGVSFLNLMVNGILAGILENLSFSIIYDRIVANFSVTIVLGFFSIIPFKFVQSIEYNREEI